jgi:hypothetical protein
MLSKPFNPFIPYIAQGAVCRVMKGLIGFGILCNVTGSNSVYKSKGGSMLLNEQFNQEFTALSQYVFKANLFVVQTNRRWLDKLNYFPCTLDNPFHLPYSFVLSE